MDDIMKKKERKIEIKKRCVCERRYIKIKDS